MTSSKKTRDATETSDATWAGGMSSQALELLRDELLAMDPARIIPINVDLPAAAMTVLTTLAEVRSYQPALNEIFGADKTRCIDRLELVARAALGAHARWSVRPRDKDMRSLVRKLSKARDVLVAEVRPLILHGVIQPSAVDELVGGQRFDSLCLDVLQLVSIFQGQWVAVRPVSGLDEAYLARAENLADELVLALSERRQPPLSPEADLRNRAFSLMAHTYDDVRRLITYLRWKKGDQDVIAPSLWTRSSTARRGRAPRAKRTRTKQRPR